MNLNFIKRLYLRDLKRLSMERSSKFSLQTSLYLLLCTLFATALQAQVTINSVTPSACSGTNNTYSAVVSYTLGGAGLTTGELVITSLGGKSNTIKSPQAAGTYSTTLTGLNADGASHTLNGFFTQNNPPAPGTTTYNAPASCISISCSGGQVAKSETFSNSIPLQTTELNDVGMPIPKFNTMGGTRTLQKVLISTRVTAISHVLCEYQAETVGTGTDVTWSVYGSVGIGGGFNPPAVNTRAEAALSKVGVGFLQQLVPAGFNSSSWLGDILVGSKLSTVARMNNAGAINTAMQNIVDPRTIPEWVTTVTGDATTDDDFFYTAPFEVANTGNMVITSVFTDYQGVGNIDFKMSTLSGLGLSGGGGNYAIFQGTKASGAVDVTYFYCEAETVCLGSTVFSDLNNNGIHDAGEVGIDGASVQLYKFNGSSFVAEGSPVVTSGGSGNYLFCGLTPGDYKVGVTPPSGFPLSSTDIASTANPNNDTDGDDNGIQTVSGGEALSALITLTVGGETGIENEPGTGGAQDDANENSGNMSLDFGFYAPCLSIGSTAFNDVNNNGIQDAGDVGLSGLTVTLYQANGTTPVSGVSPVTTNGNGDYVFNCLPAGTYVVGISAPTATATSSTPVLPNGATADKTNNGTQAGGAGTAAKSGQIILAIGTAPTGESDAGAALSTATDANSYSTVDFGFANVALPVDLIDFRATPGEESIELSWKTANERDFNYFELQRSSDGKEFVGLAVIKGNKSEFYGYRDAAAIEGINYYRLNMVDKDGSSKLSRIVAIKFEVGQTYLLVESPANNKSFVVFTNVNQPKIQLFSTSGTKVPMTISDMGNNRRMVNVPNVSSGLYILKMEKDGKTFTQKVVIP